MSRKAQSKNYAVNNLVNYMFGGQMSDTTGVIEKILPDGRLLIQPISGGQQHIINPTDIVAIAPNPPATVRMPK